MFALGLKVDIGQKPPFSCSLETVAAATKYLVQTGIELKRLMRGFALGNYHQLVPSDTEAGRAFNRRIELRPTY